LQIQVNQLSSKNHPDDLTEATYQGVATQYGALTMLTYTSAALVSLLCSFSSVSAVKTADQAVALQPAIASQIMEFPLTQLPHPLSHRGSGRIDYRTTN
jgi:hypothetical protein